MLICLKLLVSNNQWRKLILKGQCQFQGYFSKMQSDTQDGCNCLFPRSRTLHWIRMGSSCRGQCKSTRNTQRDLLHNTGIYNNIASNCLVSLSWVSGPRQEGGYFGGYYYLFLLTLLKVCCYKYGTIVSIVLRICTQRRIYRFTAYGPGLICRPTKTRV